MTAKTSNTEQELVSIRDTVESIWIAIVLAFVLRAFLIEAFVIPTGSMAPRLMGEHWDLTCTSCGYDYAFGYSQKDSPNRGEKKKPGGNRCPNCGDTESGREYINGGDRVLVLKYLYQFRQPDPWDVVVFKNPQNNRENYIKRLIGLPGETIEIVHGDIFYKASDEAGWQIRRKPRRAQEAMWQVIFDNDYRPSPDRRNQGPSPEWEAAVERWERRQDGRVFVLRGGGHEARLDFRADRRDFMPLYGYNSSHTESTSMSEEVDVCTDLSLSGVMFPATADAATKLLLTSFEHEFTGLVKADGTVSLSHRLGEGAQEEWGRAQLPPLPLGQGAQVALTHVDFRVTLWVNGQAVLESTDQQYKPDVDALRRRVLEAGLDRSPDWLTGMRAEAVKAALLRLEPVLVRHWMASALPQGIAEASARDPQVMRMWLRETPAAAVADVLSRSRPGQAGPRIPAPRVRVLAQGEGLELHHLRLMRDVYYTSPKLDRQEDGPEGEYASAIRVRVGMPGWGATGNPIRLARNDENPDLDEFFVLGDNSPQSLDGRLWVKAAPTLRLYDQQHQPLYSLGTVPRYNLIGKAFFVYWPAGFRVPGLPRLAVVPNVGKMRLIR